MECGFTDLKYSLPALYSFSPSPPPMLEICDSYSLFILLLIHVQMTEFDNLVLQSDTLIIISVIKTFIKYIFTETNALPYNFNLN